MWWRRKKKNEKNKKQKLKNFLAEKSQICNQSSFDPNERRVTPCTAHIIRQIGLHTEGREDRGVPPLLRHSLPCALGLFSFCTRIGEIDEMSAKFPAIFRSVGGAAIGTSVSSAAGSAPRRRPESDVLLIARKMLSVDPSRRSLVLNSRNRDGDTMLHAACRAGHSKVVAVLLDEGAPELDVDALTEGGFSPLAYAARGGFGIQTQQFIDIVVQLVASGADAHSLLTAGSANSQRFLPVHNETRALVLETIRSSQKEYFEKFRNTMMNGLKEPFSRTPEVLVDIMIEYVIGVETAATLNKSASATAAAAAASQKNISTE